MTSKIVLLVLIVACSSPLAAADRTPQRLNGTLLKPYRANWLTVASAVNNRGEIAGYAVSPDDEWVAFVRSSSGRYQRIADRGFVADMNDRGDVVGVIFPPEDTGWIEGFVWSRRRGLQSLGSFLPASINAGGDMAGSCEPPGTLARACVMRDGIVSVIREGADARGINRAGTVVGTYGDNRAYRLTRDFEFVDLGRAVAEDINDHGVIAGHRWLQVPNRGERAVVTTFASRTVRSPGDVGLGVAINDKGWVISIAFRPTGDGGEEAYCFAWNSSTRKRVALESTSTNFISVDAINDDGLVVGNAEGQPIVWKLRKQRHD
jgi:hypothetical protein